MSTLAGSKDCVVSSWEYAQARSASNNSSWRLKDMNTTAFAKCGDNGCSLAIVHDLGCDWRQFFELPSLSVGDLQRRSESVCPVRAVFAEPASLESLSREIDGCIPVSCVIIIPQTIRITLFVREQKCCLETRVSLFLRSRGRWIIGEGSTSEGNDGIGHSNLTFDLLPRSWPMKSLPSHQPCRTSLTRRL